MPYKSVLVTLCLFIFVNTFSQVEPPVSSNEIHGDSILVESSFPGGLPAWRQYLEKNLNAAVATDNGAPAGEYTVRVRFIVAKDGSIADIIPLTKFGYGMEQEVVRLIKRSGNWETGTINGNPVNSYHEQPVKFVITYEGLDITTKVAHKLFTGIENEVHISADRVKPKDLSATITNGRITPLENGNFIVKVNDTTRRAVITVYNVKKSGKEIGAESFEVRPQREAPDAKKE